MPNKHKRINQIAKLATHNSYETIWDLCCDHGLIGQSIIKIDKTQHVVFVDIVKDITNRLYVKFEATYITIPENISIINKDILDLKIKDNKKNCFIISGIGGYLSLEMVQKIRSENQSSDILICAHQNIIQLREFLSKESYTLITEQLVEENDQIYELILISAAPDSSSPKVSNTGSVLWGEFTEIHRRYIDKQIAYLSKVTSHKPTPYLNDLLESYKDISNKNT